MTLITNTEKNCRFYEKNGFVRFAENELNRKGKSIMNYSYAKEL